MDDLEALIDELRGGAGRRGLQLLDAAFPGDPTFALHHETTSVEEALDLAQQMLAPFITISVTHLDADELLHAYEHAPPPALIRLAREHDGKPMGLAMRWFGLGATALYLVGTDWSDDIADLREQWQLERRAAWTDERDIRSVRVAHLTEQVELDPRYRAASQTQRTTIGRVIIDELRTGDDDATTVKWALENASRALRENAAIAYAPLESQVGELAEELCETDEWRRVRTGKERDVVARAFLLQLTGYAPSAAFAERLARLASKWR